MTKARKPAEEALPIETPLQAHELLNRAAILRDDAEHYGFSGESLVEADGLEAAALAYLYPEAAPAVGGDKGELVPLDATPKPRRSPKVSALADNERLSLASEARAEELAIDMAECAGAETSIEKAMLHQMAAAHALSLRLVGRANLEIEGMGRWDQQGRGEAVVQITRLSNGAARLMQSYQQGVLTLAKIRSGGSQIIVVQHVQVNEGGQAVIAGQARGAGHKGGSSGK